jgi:hypothetical protein
MTRSTLSRKLSRHVTPTHVDRPNLQTLAERAPGALCTVPVRAASVTLWQWSESLVTQLVCAEAKGAASTEGASIAAGRSDCDADAIRMASLPAAGAEGVKAPARPAATAAAGMSRGGRTQRTRHFEQVVSRITILSNCHKIQVDIRLTRSGQVRA